MKKPRGIRFRISRTYRANVGQPFHYVVVGGNGEPMTNAENFTSMADTWRRVEGLWAGFAAAFGWPGGELLPLPLTDDSLVPISGGKFGFKWKGLVYGAKLSVQKIAREMIKDFDAQAARMQPPMKISGLSRKSAARKVSGLGSMLKPNRYISPTMRKKMAREAARTERNRGPRTASVGMEVRAKPGEDLRKLTPSQLIARGRRVT